jgi:hypothetical protein
MRTRIALAADQPLVQPFSGVLSDVPVEGREIAGTGVLANSSPSTVGTIPHHP